MIQQENNYKSYILIGQTGKLRFEINWSKTQKFNKFNSQKYKLQKIDFFTTQFKNRNELLIFLFNENLINKQQLENMTINILPISIKTKDKDLSSNNPLVGDILYRPMNKLFDCDIDLFSIFKQQIIEPDFCLLLKKYYIEEGKYNKHKLYELEDKIKQLKNNIQLYPDNTKIKNYYFSLIKKFNSLNESYSLLNSIIRYNQLLNNNYYIDNELKLSIDNNINEFISREKYYVTGYKDGVNDNRTLFYEFDNNFNKKINYKQLHYLISIIQMYILNKENKAAENSCNSFEKQLSLF